MNVLISEWSKTIANELDDRRVAWQKLLSKTSNTNFSRQRKIRKVDYKKFLNNVDIYIDYSRHDMDLANAYLSELNANKGFIDGKYVGVQYWKQVRSSVVSEKIFKAALYSRLKRYRHEVNAERKKRNEVQVVGSIGDVLNSATNILLEIRKLSLNGEFRDLSEVEHKTINAMRTLCEKFE